MSKKSIKIINNYKDLDLLDYIFDIHDIDVLNNLILSLLSATVYQTNSPFIDQEFELFLLSIINTDSLSNREKYCCIIYFLDNYTVALKKTLHCNNDEVLNIKNYFENDIIYNFICSYLKDINNNIEQCTDKEINELLFLNYAYKKYISTDLGDELTKIYFNIFFSSIKHLLSDNFNFASILEYLSCLKSLFINPNANFSKYETELTSVIKYMTQLPEYDASIGSFYTGLVKNNIVVNKEKIIEICRLYEKRDKPVNTVNYVSVFPLTDKAIESYIAWGSVDVAINLFLTEKQQYMIYKSNKKPFIEKLSERKDLSEKMANRIYSFTCSKNIKNDLPYCKRICNNLIKNTDYKKLRLKLLLA